MASVYKIIPALLTMLILMSACVPTSEIEKTLEVTPYQVVELEYMDIVLSNSYEGDINGERITLTKSSETTLSLVIPNLAPGDYILSFELDEIILKIIAAPEVPDKSFTKPESIHAWLLQNNLIRKAIRYESPSSRNLFDDELVEESYDDWIQEDKDLLSELFEDEWNWLYGPREGGDHFSMPLNCTNCLANLASSPGSNAITIINDEALAKRVYLSHVAHTLAVDIGGAVSWALNDLSSSNLHHLLNSRSIMQRYGSAGYLFGQPNAQVNHRSKYLGNVTTSTPRYAYAFLVENNLLKKTERETVYAILEWSRDNLVHYYGSSSYSNMQDHWGYPSRTPISLMIEGTIRAGESSAKHWTAGCHGTVGFLKQLLRVVNIPVETIFTCGHGLAHFPTLGLYLDHGDNPYNANVRNSGRDISNLLIGQNAFTEQFSASPDFLSPNDPLCENIGKTATDF